MTLVDLQAIFCLVLMAVVSPIVIFITAVFGIIGMFLLFIFAAVLAAYEAVTRGIR